MNFEFLQNLKGLKGIYKYCKNAEDLALTKPDCSMFSSRKSGETLARFIYLNAYKEAAKNLSFSDILTDYKVKRYIDNRNVLNALHSIRKNGNSAVHEESDNTSIQAIELLENLHYVAGEIARKKHLIDSYPQFNKDIEEHEGAALNEFNPAQIAEKMFYENVARYKAEKLFEEYRSFCKPFCFTPGNSEINEYIEFKSKPSDDTVHQLQGYFGYLAMKAIKFQYEEAPEREFKYKASIKIYGEQEQETTDIFDFMECLMEDMPQATHFSISSSFLGHQFAGQVDDEINVPLYDHMKFDQCDNAKDITYKSFEFLYNSGEGICNKFESGSWLDLKTMLSSDILDKDYGEEWWGFTLDLYCHFDFEKHPNILSALQKIVIKHIPSEWIEQVKSEWTSEGPEYLVSGSDWTPRKLRDVQDFLDEINEAILPMKDECDCNCSGVWYITNGPKAIAMWDWFEDGFKVVGTEL